MPNALTVRNIIRDEPHTFTKAITHSSTVTNDGTVTHNKAVLFAEGDGVNTEELAGNKTLAITDAMFQRLDPGGSARDVVLPAEASSKGLIYRILNTADGDENLVVKDDGDSTIATVGQNEAAWFCCNGTAWTHQGIETIALS